MARQEESVSLKRVHAQYLESLRAAAELPAGLTLNGEVLEGPRVAMEALRDQLTETLAERGFGEDYSITAEGALIEELIDALHLP